MTSSEEEGGKEGTTGVGEEGGGPDEANGARAAQDDVSGRRPRKKGRKWGKRKRAPKDTGAVNPEAVEMPAAVGSDLQEDTERGEGGASGKDGPRREETGVVKKQVRSGRNGMREGAVHAQDAKRGGVVRSEENARSRANGLHKLGTGAEEGDEANGRNKEEQATGVQLGKQSGPAAEDERSPGQIYRRKKGRGADDRRREAEPVASIHPAVVGKVTEQEGPSRGVVLGSLGEISERDQSRQRPSGLIIKGVKGFRKKHPAAQVPDDVSVAPQAVTVPAEGGVDMLGAKGAKKKADRAAEKRAAGVIVKGIKGFQKKKGVAGGG